MANHLQNESSPYLLQHADNPVDWFPWGEEAFMRARQEDKPVFLSVGYSTCHWCHVMAHESFEDAEIAALLNESFISIKVDREERPDVDSVYMTVCQTMTGSGGWPMSIFMSPDQKPFFAGTYFPKTALRGTYGFRELLITIRDAWQNEREVLLASTQRILRAVEKSDRAVASAAALPEERLIETALTQYRASFDATYGGFGRAPKFPAPHNLLFLMQAYQKRGDGDALKMVEKTLTQMARGGLFDQIGYGFSRYSTDRRFLVPHFEKMLYDNALLILAYCRAFELTGKSLYREVAKKTAEYVMSELRSTEGAFMSAQDADSDGTEGKFYVFTPEEIITVSGEADTKAFCAAYDITEQGNFEGKSIPNLLLSDEPMGRFDALLPKLRAYRKQRTKLHTDDKILTVWNGLMIAALCALYRITRNSHYLITAKQTQDFIEKRLCDGDTLYVSYRDGRRGAAGFIDDYAAYCFALIALYDVTLDDAYLTGAWQMATRATEGFFDNENGGYTLSGKENEALILNKKETYDGAIPSGNSLMAFNLVRLHTLKPKTVSEELLRKQMTFLSGEATHYPAGYAMFLMALSDYLDLPQTVTVIRATEDRSDMSDIVFHTDSATLIRVLDAPTEEYRLQNNDTTLYVCRDRRCLPPMHIDTYLAEHSQHEPVEDDAFKNQPSHHK